MACIDYQLGQLKTHKCVAILCIYFLTEIEVDSIFPLVFFWCYVVIKIERLICVRYPMNYVDIPLLDILIMFTGTGRLVSMFVAL